MNKEFYYQHISIHNQFAEKSSEELRFEDICGHIDTIDDCLSVPWWFPIYRFVWEVLSTKIK